MKRLWPGSLAGRTALVLILGLMGVQAVGLTIHAFDRVELQRAAEARETALRSYALWRALVTAPPERRPQILAEADLPATLVATYDAVSTLPPGLPHVPPPLSRWFRLDGAAGPPVPPPPPRRFRPAEVQSGALSRSSFAVSMRFPDQGWLNLTISTPALRPWHSDNFLVAFLAMSLAAALMTWWAVRRLTRPVTDLAAAAERLGRGVNAPPLPENGPREVATAAAAFNTMASNIRRFVADRTQMLAAISHDLRTPITRLRLRAEFLDDDEQRAKMLADLAEMEAMIAATLTFARDDAANEPAGAVDLASLARTVLDEAVDANPELAPAITFDGPEHLVLQLRPVAMKRALTNLVGNALKYGDAARLKLEQRDRGAVLILDDDGPGIPESAQEAVFQPFHRVEGSRNRETGGTGLGLTIARSILRAHGGEVTLSNRDGGGLRVVARLPG
ncbi:ATP-binding protein [Sediminicoccus sp. KRV36]|uniref:ATP-binding protein n=1 Tax=Sediminicoccus sp. KRV36 TaxID=3133721 RepID=UPI002010A7D0|nr:ATP-binding protein [Sediminicoccus rosea]UPY34985.1 HAMP domain-containing protein [Sediminicoccus rosea]